MTRTDDGEATRIDKDERGRGGTDTRREEKSGEDVRGTAGSRVVTQSSEITQIRKWGNEAAVAFYSLLALDEARRRVFIHMVLYA